MGVSDKNVLRYIEKKSADLKDAAPAAKEVDSKMIIGTICLCLGLAAFVLVPFWTQYTEYKEVDYSGVQLEAADPNSYVEMASETGPKYGTEHGQDKSLWPSKYNKINMQQRLAQRKRDRVAPGGWGPINDIDNVEWYLKPTASADGVQFVKNNFFEWNNLDAHERYRTNVMQHATRHDQGGEADKLTNPGNALYRPAGRKLLRN
eukprot:CAMPEP_0197846156 /NCGR_PEP_ID=MMETSP1438-20131217/2952_1 /TAXON_ID=1461541 /ORGANISM="Pterosperma sp., Strain CCMP1384" /LENGTH=204 /DNA_ID=CAMNT_0043457703 /DNA_START=388 /DNA_END=1002 /DNA_ORIENTATION=+